MDNPPCSCHGEPMYWTKDARYRAGGFWRCAATHRERKRVRYENLASLDYNLLLLKHRRYKGLVRMARRHEHPGVLSG